MDDKWPARRSDNGPSMRVVLLPGKEPAPSVRLKHSQLQRRLAHLHTKPAGDALGFVGLEDAQVAFVRPRINAKAEASNCGVAHVGSPNLLAVHWFLVSCGPWSVIRYLCCMQRALL